VYGASLLFTVIFPGKLRLASFTGAKDDGGVKWSYKTCKAPVKSSSPTNQHLTVCRSDALPVVSEYWREIWGIWCLPRL